MSVSEKSVPVLEKGPAWTPLRWWIVIGSTVVGLVIFSFLAVMIGGLVSGSEFSPQTFCRRTFYYSRLPVFRLQLGRTEVNSLTGNLACSTLITSNITGAIPGKIRWDLIDYSVSGRPTAEGDAAILMKYLEARDYDGNSIWETWTKDNSALAKILWPVIQQLAIHRCYFAIPEIMQFARTKPTTSELSSLIAKVSQESAAIRAQAFLDANDPQSAQALLDWAISLKPSEALSELRARIPSQPSNEASETKVSAE